MEDKILEVRNLKTYFRTDAGLVKAVNDVSFSVERGKTLGIVGESGCGKSITSLSIMQLVETPPGRYEGGEILFDGEDLLKMSENQMREIRGNKIAMIFQEPMTSLNPVFTIGQQLMEAILLHEKATKQQAREKGIEMLKKVKIPLAEKRFDEYPHQLSGGMRQRVMIAMALCCNPQLLICDEPTTALDVTIQAQIMDLILELKEEMGMAVLLITHDMGLVAQMADRVLVMYAGQLIEQARVLELFDHPAHPYTRALLRSVPGIRDEENRRLESIEGIVPEHYDRIRGCRFARRCPFRTAMCMKPQQEVPVGDSHIVRCCRAKEVLTDG